MSAVANLKEELYAAITEEFLAPEGIGCCNHGRDDDHGHAVIKETRVGFAVRKKGIGRQKPRGSGGFAVRAFSSSLVQTKKFLFRGLFVRGWG